MSKIVDNKDLDGVKELMKQGRVSFVTVNPDLIMKLLLSKKPILVDMKELPEDAFLLGINYDPRVNMFLMKVVSKEFETVKEGEVIPFIDGTVTLINCTCNCKDKTIDDVTKPVNEIAGVDSKPIPEEK